jgi:hypothetical protein
MDVTRRIGISKLGRELQETKIKTKNVDKKPTETKSKSYKSFLEIEHALL